MKLIESREVLAASLAKACVGGVLALDTEFVWERTYVPALGIVQFAGADGKAFLIDAVALDDWAPLKQALEDSSLVKILHDAPQDLTILRSACDAIPCNIFDTRLAAGFAGLLSTISLHNLLDTLLTIHLDKGQTRTDWLRRPLSDAQLEYAADDVRYLARARSDLLKIIAEAGHTAKLEEDLAALDNPTLTLDRDPREAYLRFRSLGRYQPRALSVLREVAAWREKQAARKNRPRKHVLTDDVLFGLAKVQPATLDDLRKVRDFPFRAIKSVGEPILQAVRKGLLLDESEYPQPPAAVNKSTKELANRILAVITERCEPVGLDPALVCSRGELTNLLLAEDSAASASEHRLLQGWRAMLIGNEIAAGTVPPPTPVADDDADNDVDASPCTSEQA